MKLLKVIPNPFTLLDSAGMPAGFTFSDPFHWGANRRFDVVGGRLTKAVDKSDGPPAPEDAREVKVVVGSVVSLKPTPVVNSEYHRARILSGEMIAADKESAAECGISKFKDAAAVLADYRNLRVAEWQAEHGGQTPPAALMLFSMAGDAVKITDASKKPVAAPAQPPPPVVPAMPAKRATPIAPAVVEPAPVSSPDESDTADLSPVA